MSGLSRKYNSKEIAALWRETQRIPAVIVGVDTQNETQYSGKFDSTSDNVVKQSYRIRLLGIDPPDKPENNLPLAEPLQLSSGLGAQNSGIIRYAPNSLVYVSQDPFTGAYFIERVIPNHIAKLYRDTNFSGKGIIPSSGFIPGLSVIPNNYISNGDINSAELFNTQVPSDEDVRHDFKPKLPKIKSACDNINLDGVNDAIRGMIEDVEALRTDLLGEDSLLGQAGEFLGDAQDFVTGIPNAALGSVDIGEETYEISIGNAAGDIASIMAALIQEARKWILRKITTVANIVTGKIPLSARYIANEALDKGLTTITCLIAKILANLETMVANILKGIVDKILNATECLVENIVGGIIGNILGNITAAIKSIINKVGGMIGELGGAIEEITELAGDMLDFVISILDIFLCQKKNICPDTSTWDFLQGSKPINNKELNFESIFNKAKSVTETVANTVGNLSTDFVKLNFDDIKREGSIEAIFTKDDGTPYNPLDEIDPGIIWQNVIEGGCNTGAISCGPPKVVFFGGDGDGATGNPVVNLAGELIGVDIITPGQYNKPPLISFEDDCGNGKGAIGKAILGRVKNKIVYEWKERVINAEEGSFANFTIVRSGRTDVKSRVKVKTLRSKGSAIAKKDFKFLKEKLTFKPGETEINFRVKVRAKGKGGEGFQNTEEEGKEKFYVSITALELKKEKNKNIKLKIKKKNKYAKCIITDSFDDEDLREDDIIDDDDLDDEDVDDNFDDDDKDDKDDDILGVTDVVMDDTGYGYLQNPIGQKGGGGRIWANRCQTTVQRANFNWDTPYDKDDEITAYYGDTITLPGKKPVLIDQNFTADMIPGCIVKGTNPKIKDMTKFDYKVGKVYEEGKSYKFGAASDYKLAKEQGFSDQDIRFYLENKFFIRIGGVMREKLLDPNFGKIPEFSVTVTAPGCPPGTPEDPNERPSPPTLPSSLPTASLIATASAGGSYTLRWSSTGGSTYTLTGEPNPGASGSKIVSPKSSTSYTYTVTDASGKSTSANATVVVPEASVAPPPSASLIATASAGGSHTLTWTSTGGSTYTLTGEPNPGSSGNKKVSPKSSTSYTYTVKGPGGTTSVSATVIVTETTKSPTPPTAPTAPTASLTATKISGGSSTLTWSSTGGSKYTLTGEPDPGSTGSKSVSPTSTTTYTYVVEDASGNTASASAIVAVSAAATPSAPPPPPTPPTPPTPDDDDDGDSGSNKEVVAILDNKVFIENGGFKYCEDDELIIGDGNNGSGRLIVDRRGTIRGVVITNPGIGFTSIPEMRINTKCGGFNANLKPILKFINVNDSGFVVPPGTPTIKVIDCVGKV